MKPFTFVNIHDLDLRRPFKALSICLQVKEVSEDLAPILNAYGLIIIDDVIKTQSQAPGQHKLEALKLFMASLEIQMKWPEAISSIYQVNELRKLINQHSEEEVQLNDLGLWVDDSVSFYLKEMGFEISSNHLSRDQILKLHITQLQDVLIHGRISA